MADKHPIQVVARRTGLSPHVIRAWERRYQAVTPTRTSTNRRVFTIADIDRLILLRRAVHAGHRIGDVAALADDKLLQLVRASEGHDANGWSERPIDSGRVGDLLPEAIRAVELLDSEALDATFTRAAVRLSRPVFMEELVLPLMQHVGRGWREGRLRVAHEHLATASVRSFLGNLERTYPSSTSSPCIVVATPAGQLHELGALAAAATASAEGFRITYLGASLPAEEVLVACELRGCSAVALSITYPADDPALPHELRRIARGLPPGVALLAGGQAVDGYRAVLEESGASVLDDLGALRTALENVRRTPASAKATADQPGGAWR